MQSLSSPTIRQLFFNAVRAVHPLVFAVLLLTRWLWFYPNELTCIKATSRLQQQSLNAAGFYKNQLVEHAANFAGRHAALDFMQNPNVRALVIEGRMLGLHQLDVDALVLSDSSKGWLAPLKNKARSLSIFANHADSAAVVKALTRCRVILTAQRPARLLLELQATVVFLLRPHYNGFAEIGHLLPGWAVSPRKDGRRAVAIALRKIALLHIQPMQDSPDRRRAFRRILSGSVTPGACRRLPDQF